MKQSEIQLAFFNHIKGKLQAHLSLVDEIAELLNISNDSAYRRIRGDKELSMNEIQRLCQHFKISLDQLMSLQSNAYIFYGNLVNNNEFNFEMYLQSMLENVKQIAALPDCHFYYEAKDIPPFHHFQFPLLAAFKYFFWMRTILQDFNHVKKKFYPDEFSEQLKQTGSQIGKLYTTFASSELWNVETLNSTLRQIDFCAQSGMFQDKKTLSSIYESLLESIEHIEAQAETGKKFMPGDTTANANGDFNLYINEVLLGHNTMFINNSASPLVYINHNVLNFMITHDQRFCEYTNNSLQMIISNSNLISKVNQKERSKFFNVLKGKIAEMMH